MTWRWLRDGEGAPGWNMAVDEALLDTFTPVSEPVLRTYAWDRPTLSVGRSQPVPSHLGLGKLHAHGIALTRRPTGGLAVLHQHEWTYSVVGGLETEAFGGAVLDTYKRVADGLVRGLDRLGISASVLDPDAPVSPTDTTHLSCFRSRSHHEISVVGRGKLIGSAQRRRGRAFLQHGSILNDVDPALWAIVFGGGDDAAGWTTLRKLSGVVQTGDALAAALAHGFGEAFSVTIRPDELTDAERLRAVELYSWKYASLDWNVRGIRGERERRWGPPWAP